MAGGLLVKRSAARGPASAVPAAIPAAAAEALGVAVGDVVTVAGVSPGAVATEVAAGPWEVRVVGVYEPTSRRAAFWAVDPLRGAGHVADFIVPGTAGVQRTDAVGPFVVAPGTVEFGHARLDPRVCADTVTHGSLRSSISATCSRALDRFFPSIVAHRRRDRNVDLSLP